MLRSLFGFAIIAVAGIVAVKLIFGVLGFALSLLMTLLWLAAIGFVFYLLLKIVSPRTARRVRETVRGPEDSA
jgi:hypothetical protein